MVIKEHLGSCNVYVIFPRFFPKIFYYVKFYYHKIKNKSEPWVSLPNISNDLFFINYRNTKFLKNILW